MAVISYVVKFLSKSGAIATFILAGLIFSLGGIKWSVPVLTFFIFSSILSKLRKKKNTNVESYFEKSGVRDYMQVLANGGLGGVLVVINWLYPDEIYFLLYISTLAAVCADSWATEIGTWKKTATYNILNRKQVVQGMSGGASIIGTAGAFAGSLAIAFSGILWVEFSYILYVILILLAGLTGCFVDSVLGAAIQKQYKCSICANITERGIHCGLPAEHYKGFKWLNNDVVNFLAGLSGAFLILILNSIIKF